VKDVGESGWRNTNDRVRIIAEEYRSPENLRISPEVTLPAFIA
jgi:hypothetical protein